MNTIDEELKKLDNVMIKYISALKVLETQLEIINDDFKYIKKYNPIEHIKTRIKSADSIINKLYKDNLDFTLDNVEKYINDIVGVRIICAFESDVFELINIIRNSNIIHVIKEKDFITNPKNTGYRSYHLIVEVPVELINEKVMVKAEIQIRTLAMDLWASLEHKLKYKSDYCTDDISKKLVNISSQLHDIDEEMMDLVNKENEIKLLQEGDDKI
ncbi:MAG: GTP pyrophosphokinase family protein [Candidatus Coprovivens sp.]